MAITDLCAVNREISLPRSTNFIVRVYITECNNGILDMDTTITSFPSSPTQISDLTKFLTDIYDEFRRLQLYDSTILLYLQRLREQQEHLESSEYDYAEDTPDDHLFRGGPLPDDFTFEILGRDIRENRVHRGHQVWLVDVCYGNNVLAGWRVVLEIV